MPRPYLLDTDVMVDFLRGQSAAVSLVKTHADRIILSSIVIAELYAGVRSADELATLDRLVALFRNVPVTAENARTAGLYKKRYTKSHGVGLADCIIAATAENEQADLLTLNIKHYPMFKGLKPPYAKS